MKSYAERYISKNTLINTNINTCGDMVWTPLENIKDEYKSWMDGTYDEEEYVCIYYRDIDEFCIDIFNYEWCLGSDFDEDEYDWYINSLIKNANHYLVCAYNCTWDNRSGYRFADNVQDSLYRDYDVHQYVTGSSRGGKVLLISESSHDCPMGYGVCVIALTKKEYDRLEDSDWDTVMKFANEKQKSIIDLTH